MTYGLESRFVARCLTPGEGHFFYGYYDNPAFSADGRFHLCHRVEFCDRLPRPDDVATLGQIDLASGQFLPFAHTTAWNFQQGSMLQWHPPAPDDQVIFNRFAAGRLVGVVRDLRTGAERWLERPLANLDPTGRWGLSVNFGRLYDFRPGYGYPHVPDAWARINHPADDGVWLVDLATGQSRLILSLEAIAQVDPAATAGRKLLVNHLTFNPDGTRFVFLPRTFPTPEHPDWATALYTADLEGRVHVLQGYGYASHYHWRDPQHLVCYAGPGGGHLEVLTDLTPERQRVDPTFFVADGHCCYSPDRQWLLYDSYPKDGYRELFLYDLTRRRGRTLGRFASGPHDQGDIRTDLHPRWDRAGRRVSFDSTHQGRRAVYLLDLTEVAG